MFELLQYSFMQNAIAASFFIVVLCAVAGVLVVVNRMVFISGGVAHASYGGIGLALWFGFPPALGALSVAVMLGIFLGIVRQKNFEKADALLNAFWAAGMAFGIAVNDLHKGYSVDFLNYLFGNILLVSKADLWLSGIMAVAAVLFTLRYYKVIVICSADQDYAATLGIPVKKVNLIMLVFLCSCVVTLMKMSGLVLVMALVSIPASIAETMAKKLSTMMILSGVISLIAIFGGLIISKELNITPSAVTVFILTLMYAVNIFFTWRSR